MEPRLRQSQVTVRTAAILLAVFIALGPSPAAGQKAPPFYYNLDKEIKIEGVIRDIRLEPRYESSAPFLIILMDDAKSGRAYSVEAGPAGFFEQDFHKGEKIKIVGSLCNMELVCCDVIAREVQCRGSTWAVRDKQGFPNWRKGSMSGMGRKIEKSGC
jgi:hypothetical protein